jgi:hypothetical protein
MPGAGRATIRKGMADRNSHVAAVRLNAHVRSEGRTLVWTNRRELDGTEALQCEELGIE